MAASFVKTPEFAAPRTGVLLLTFGGPRSAGEVPRFLFEILRDPNTLQVPAPGFVQDLLAKWIAARRGPEVARQYGEIGGASPLVAATERMAQGLSATLAARGLALPVLVAHRYLPGHARAAVKQALRLGLERLLAIPLYPHFSWATTGSSVEQLASELTRGGFTGQALAIRSYPDAPGYLDAVSARLAGTLAEVKGPPERTLVLCSAHGLPARYVERGDPYRLELYRSVDALRSRFPERRFALSFQSRVGPAQWLEPYTDRILPELAAQGVQDLVFLPIAFVNDHLETLYEIGHTYFAAARRLGMTPHRVPAIEDHGSFLALLAGQVEDALAGRGAVPLDELVPPSQAGRRAGWWLWSAWLAAFSAALANALAHALKP
jgi:ferrochelatase